MLCGDEVNAIVIDIGTSMSRFGAAGQATPYHCFDSCMDMNNAVIRNSSDANKMESTTTVAPEVNWDEVEALLHSGIKSRMKVDPSEYACMFAQGALFQEVTSQEKLVELCFESVLSPAMFAMPSPVLSAFSVGRPTAIIVDIGHCGTSIVPVVDGFELKKAKISTQRGGLLMENILSSRIASSVHDSVQPSTNMGLNPTQLNNIVLRDVKHWMSVIPHYRVDSNMRSTEGLAQLGLILPPGYELPDGTVINSNYDTCTVGEHVFFPESNSYDLVQIDGSVQKLKKRTRALCAHEVEINGQDSLQDLIYYAANQSDTDSRKELLGNIFLCGGGAQISGLTPRLTKELCDIVPTNMKPKLIGADSLDRLHASWIGGSVVSICGSFEQLWISKQEYDEIGVRLASERFIY